MNCKDKDIKDKYEIEPVITLGSKGNKQTIKIKPFKSWKKIINKV